MKIVADTNVLISATFWKGDSFRIIEKAEKDEIKLILSKAIIEEYNSVLNYKEIQDKIKSKNLEINLVLEKLVEMAIIVEPSKKLNIVKEDPDDDKFIEAALEGGADYIITQDKHLLKVREFEGVKIVRPEEFLRLLS